ncbi:MAG: FAD-dependent oxidoreductase [Planctomycetes bacterium]|nr:FAD-dependent oxidoreductase [Planctomycetota bacterium]
MSRLSSLSELDELRRVLASAANPDQPRIVVCAGTACHASGAGNLVRAAKQHILDHGLVGKVALRVTGCHGFCEMGPFVLTEPQLAFYAQVKEEDIPRVIAATLAGKYVDDLLYRDPDSGKVYYRRDDIPFFKHQKRDLLGLNQRIDPIRIHDYIAEGGYASLAQVLARRDPAWVVQEVLRSGLRGRGGGGFPTGRKWALLARQPSGRGKFLVCNADEGDPGAYMDRSVLEGNPHSILEGMVIGAYGTGATEGIVYVRNEYPLAIKHLTIALQQARQLGLLGTDILGTGVAFDIQIVRGAGAFVCGEETALIRSVEGKIGEPRQRPPYPVEKGIDGRPTAINNVETWANIPLVFRVGADEYARTGTPNNSGTKIFSLVGKIKNTGLVEVPMGMTIRQVVHDIGGGPSGAAPIKAVQTGGPSGGCIPAAKFDLPIDYDTLASAGSIMGSGGMIVMDENTCMVDVAKYFLAFLKDESCGKCFTCRKGTQRMHEILDDISRGRATLADLDLLEELAGVVTDTSMCGLGQTAANPVLSTLRYYRAEFERHITQKRCDAYVCRDLVGAACQAACPIGTEAWRYVAHIARGEYAEAYRAIRDANPFPSVCARVCNHPCEEHCRAAAAGSQAVAIRLLKRFITDRTDPMSYHPERVPTDASRPRVAVIGAGPAGLTAAHFLSLEGYPVTVFESEVEPGGMLYSAIPGYRLPRDVVRREIQSLLAEGIELQCGATLGREITLDSLFDSGYQAIFLALGAHKSLELGLPDEDAEGVIPSIRFLKAHNVRGEALGRGRVGVIGGGNSALDAARTALRQPEVDGVTIFYRRSLAEMPAFREEVEAALQEGITIEPLTSPKRILTREGRLTGIECIKNRLGEPDESGRRRPVPVPGSEHTVALDTLIVAISEGSDTDCVSVAGANRVEVTAAKAVRVDTETLLTNRPGVFAGGDVVTGPNTVVNAIAAGKRAAVMIDRYLRGETLVREPRPRLPERYVGLPATAADEAAPSGRVVTPRLPISARRRNFREVEAALTEEDAIREARRCLRCDLAFTESLAPAPEESAARTGGAQ